MPPSAPLPPTILALLGLTISAGCTGIRGTCLTGTTDEPKDSSYPTDSGTATGDTGQPPTSTGTDGTGGTADTSETTDTAATEDTSDTGSAAGDRQQQLERLGTEGVLPPDVFDRLRRSR